MPVHFRCPCGTILGAPDQGKGKGGECPSCGKIIVVPGNAVNADEAELKAPPKMAPAAPPPEPAPTPQAAAPAPEPAPAPAPAPAPQAAAPVPAPQPALAPGPAPAPQAAASAPAPPRPATPMPKRSVTPVPKMPATTPVPAPVAPAPQASAPGGMQLAGPAEPPLETIDDVDILPDDALEVIDEAEEAVAVPESLNALDGLGMADDEPVVEADEGEEPDMARDRGTRRGTGRASRRAGASRTGRTRRPRKCPECNAENEPGARECENCGAQLRGAPRKKPGGAGKKLVVALVLLVVLGVGGVAAVGHFAPDKLPPAILNVLKSIGIAKDQPAKAPDSEDADADAEGAKEEDTSSAGEQPPKDYVPDTGEDVEDAPSARGDSMIGLGAGGISTPDAAPDLGGDGLAAPKIPTGGGDGIDE